MHSARINLYTSVVVLFTFSLIAFQHDVRADDVSKDTAAASDPVVVALGSDEQTLVRAVQQALAQSGFEPGPADGDWGPGSWTALQRWREENITLEIPEDASRSFRRLVGVAPPASGTPQVLVDGQHMVLPAQGESRQFRWDAATNAWQAPKGFAFDSNSQGWVRLKVGDDQDLLLVFRGAKLSQDGQIVLGAALGSRRLTASLASKDGTSIGRVDCRIGEAALISEVVVPCGFSVTTAW